MVEVAAIVSGLCSLVLASERLLVDDDDDDDNRMILQKFHF